jgi:hypothetical protein
VGLWRGRRYGRVVIARVVAEAVAEVVIFYDSENAVVTQL